ncbi:MAG: right-handed parallel beta-helix repeat-containing protein, partial [Proteobacteria bacterium]|nr:right-handed parallel beta-helix repeat-containing protein [Pseudomonadota bacterium]
RQAVAIFLTLILAACGSHAQSEAVIVDTAETLQATLASAQPGQTISVLPGTYKGKFSVKAPVSGTAEKPIIIEAADGIGSVILDGTGYHITVRFNGSGHVIMRDMVITGGGYHGVFFERAAHDITIENNWIHDNTGVKPLNSHAEVKGSSGNDENRPARITIRNNRIYQTAHHPGRNFQGIDCNRCDDFHIVGNHIFDIGRPSERVHSYYDQGSCIQMKTRTQGTIIERNRIERCHIGIVYGGEGAESPEHIGGIVRNNLILLSKNISLVIAGVEDGKVFNNTFYGNYRDVLLGSDYRHNRPRNDVEIANNIFSMPPEELVFVGSSLHNNVVVAADDIDKVFIDAKAGDFQLAPSAEQAIDQGVDPEGRVLEDFVATQRPLGISNDLGAFEFKP